MALKCPGHEAVNVDFPDFDTPWWCQPCLDERVWRARAELDPCRCGQEAGEHWHG